MGLTTISVVFGNATAGGAYVPGMSDFLIVNLNLDEQPCGTYEELFLANRQKKPIILRIPQGKENTPDWLLGTIPHNTIFSKWSEVKSYIDQVNQGKCATDSRWMFFSL